MALRRKSPNFLPVDRNQPSLGAYRQLFKNKNRKVAETSKKQILGPNILLVTTAFEGTVVWTF